MSSRPHKYCYLSSPIADACICAVIVPFNLIACPPQAIAGEIGMDNILDNIANSLFNGLLPAAWSKLAPATCKQLASWLEHLKVSRRSSLISSAKKSVSHPPSTVHWATSTNQRFAFTWYFRNVPYSTSIGRFQASRWSCGCLDCIYHRATSRPSFR